LKEYNLSRIAYVNGRYVPYAHASVHIEDRGYQFADGVYEVCEVRAGKLVDERRHMERLVRSLGELKIAMPMTLKSLGVVLRETIERNRVQDGLVYLQITRGVARRDFAFPAEGTKPSIVAIARSKDRSKTESAAQAGIAVVTTKDNRWDRVDIKTVGLLPNALASQYAKEQGANEAWLIDRDGFVTEGSHSNAWMVTADKKIVTRPAEHGILRGITRTVIFEVAKKLGHHIEERPFTLKEALNAKEAFNTSATQIVMPVVKIDGTVIGDGKPGEVATALRARFYEIAEITG
jgi:D-alanine transaminase